MRNVLEWLERTSERLPNKVAVSGPECSLTFWELRRAARSIGCWLVKEAQVRPRSAVALFADKSPLALAAMLGAAYAGAFYSVIDVRQPRPRVNSILDTLGTSILLTDEGMRELAVHHVHGRDVRVMTIEDISTYPQDPNLISSIRQQASDIDPLYVTFTSGSTGTPKGVVTSHRSVLDFVSAFVEAVGIDESDVLGNQAPFDFDGSVKDIYSSLLTGASVALIPRAYYSNPTQLMDYLVDSDVTNLTWAVSALCFVTIMGGLDYRVPTKVHRVLFTGEVMPPKQLAIWQRHLPNATFINLYGPTETTCNCTYYKVDRVYGNDEVIPMGKAFANERVFLLDDHNRLVKEPGIPGEVYVSGTCLALGYLGDKDRTSRAFIQNPVNDQWLELTYRTGDLARYNETGDLVYITRKDNQIKHLGQRIELGDIECASQATQGVEQACCLYDNNRKRIVLFYVGSIDRKQLKEHLRDVLPSYMVPNNTRHIDAMPLNKNGKTDRAALATMARIKR